jgi:hypothetical protein
MPEQELSSISNRSNTYNDSSQDQHQQSIIFAPAFKKMVSYLKSKGISANAINRSATPDGRTTRADITDFINYKTIWKINKLESFLLCDVISKNPEALEIFFQEVTDLLKQNQRKIEDEEHTVENNAELEDVVLGGSQGREKLSKSGRIVTPENFRRNKEIMDSIGHEGEKFVNAYLQRLENEAEIDSFEWVSKQNTISPYDFWISLDGEPKIFIDVKSTAGGFERKLHISLSELELMSSDKQRYDLYRIFDIDENNRTAKLRIAEDVRSFAKGIIEVFKGLPEGVDADGISVDPSKSGLNFQPEIEMQLPDEPEEESSGI